MPKTRIVYRASPYRWVILGLLSVSYLLVYVHRMCPAVLAEDIMRSFGASGATTGLLASAYFYPYALMQAPGGLIADKLGPRRLVTLSMLAASLGSVLFAMSVGVGTAFWSRVLVGLGVSVVLVPTYKALTTWFPAKDYVLGASLVISIAGLGGLLAGSPLAWLSEAIGWRGSFWVIAGLTMTNALMVWFLVRDKPQDFDLPPVEPYTFDSGREQAIPVAQVLGMVLGSKDFWLLAGWFFFNGGVLFSFAGLWAGPYFMQAYAMSKTQGRSGHQRFLLWLGPSGRSSLPGSRPRYPPVARFWGGSMAAWTAILGWMLLRNGSMNLAERFTLGTSSSDSWALVRPECASRRSKSAFPCASPARSPAWSTCFP